MALEKYLDRLGDLLIKDGKKNCREVPVIVWTNKDISADERNQLKLSAQSVALKCRNGIEDVIGELQRHLPPAIAPSSSASATAVENSTTHLKRHETTSLT